MNPDTGFFVIRIRIQNLVFGDHKLKNYIEKRKIRREHPAHQNMKFLIFSYFMGSSAFQNQDPDPLDPIESEPYPDTTRNTKERQGISDGEQTAVRNVSGRINATFVEIQQSALKLGATEEFK